MEGGEHWWMNIKIQNMAFQPSQKYRCNLRKEVPTGLLDKYDEEIKNYEKEVVDLVEAELNKIRRSEEVREMPLPQGKSFVEEQHKSLSEKAFEEEHNKIIKMLATSNAEIFKQFNEGISGRVGTPNKRKRQNSINSCDDELSVIESVNHKLDSDTADSSQAMLEILNECALKVRKAIGQEVNSKICFNRTHQSTVREAVDEMVYVQNKMLLEIANLRTQVLALKMKCALGETPDKAGMGCEPMEEEGKKTPRVSNKGGNRKEGKALKKHEDSPKSTPKQVLTYSQAIKAKPATYNTIIKSVEGVSVTSEQLQGELGKNICIDDVGGGFSSLWTTRKGDLVIECSSEEQKAKLDKKLESVPNIQTSNFEKRKPTMILTGIDSQLTQEEVLVEIKTKNSLLTSKFGNDFDDNFKIVHFKACQNPKRRNYFIEVSPEMYKACSKEEKLNIGWTRHSITEHISVGRCFKCNGYGHMIKTCPIDHEKCVRCGGKHLSKTCRSNLDCSNCRKHRVPAGERSHPSNDVKCPVYCLRLRYLRERIDHGC